MSTLRHGLLLEQLSLSVSVPFVGSATVVYTPSLPEVSAPFVGSATAVYTPSVFLTGTPITVSQAGTYTWLCPAGITSVYAEGWGGGGGGGLAAGNTDSGGGGGGAYAIRTAVPVTPGTAYTIIVGAGGTTSSGNIGGAGGDSSFVGDGGVQILAKGGGGGPVVAGNHAAGGSAASSVGDTKRSGGDGGTTIGGAGQSGDGGGAGASRTGTGAAGQSGSGGGSAVGGAGGAGAGGGGAGGQGGGYNNQSSPIVGSVPGGGGGGAGGNSGSAANGADGQITIGIFRATQTSIARVQRTSVTKAQTARARVQNTATTKAQTARARITNARTRTQTSTARLSKTLTKAQTAKARVQSATSKAQTATARIGAPVIVPFIPSRTVVWDIWDLFDPNRTFSGPGNGGESFGVRLNSSGTTTTATLASGVGVTGSPSLTMTGDSGMPGTGIQFVVTIDSEQILLVSQGAGGYLIRQRGMGNTAIGAHSPGAAVSWGDSYDMPVTSTVNINTDFTADIEGTGSSLYTGWLMAFDSTQAYESDGTRYPLHASELVGVFAAGAGVTGTSKTDGPQPSAVHAPEAASDHCGAALTVPALITTDVVPGDVMVIRYTNPEAFVLDLGPRAGGVQSWFGLKRVDATDHDVTMTNPNGIVVDTKNGIGTYTGTANVEPDEPLPAQIGIARDASDAVGAPVPTPEPVPWLNVTLPGTDRYFTDGIHYSERGWPIGVLTARQGERRVPFWQSWDWHEFNYVYSGFGTDDSFAQVVINRNGMTGLLPAISLPGPQDIDGPAAYWDDGTYYFGASWYVVLVATPYLVAGPVVGGASAPPGTFIPVATFPTSGVPPVITPPSTPAEGGQGGNIEPTSEGLHVWQTF